MSSLDIKFAFEKTSMQTILKQVLDSTKDTCAEEFNVSNNEDMKSYANEIEKNIFENALCPLCFVF